MFISIISGVLLSLWYFARKQFPNTHALTVIGLCCLAFYVLSILLRIQNQRVRLLIGKSAIDEKRLKYWFPSLGFGIGVAIGLW